MLIIVSPAKSLDYESAWPAVDATQPRLLDASAALIEYLREYSPADIARLMKVSDKIAHLNVDRYAAWHRPFTEDNAKPAAFAFKGDVYTGLGIESFDRRELQSAQKQLRILSGLYGVLRPLDLMQAYRLEMSTKLPTDHGKDLYSFWGDTITDLLNQDLREEGNGILVNLASNEYAKAVNMKELDADVIEPVFQDEKNGQYKVISFSAKKARGLMAAWIIRNNPGTEADLTGFAEQGYSFAPEVSEPGRPVFRRSEAARGAA